METVECRYCGKIKTVSKFIKQVVMDCDICDECYEKNKKHQLDATYKINETENLINALKVNINPAHYKKHKLETIENIQNSMTDEEFKGYLKGNIYKYLSRYEDKNGMEDLEKAEWYLNKLKEVE